MKQVIIVWTRLSKTAREWWRTGWFCILMAEGFRVSQLLHQLATYSFWKSIWSVRMHIWSLFFNFTHNYCLWVEVVACVIQEMSPSLILLVIVVLLVIWSVAFHNLEVGAVVSRASRKGSAQDWSALCHHQKLWKQNFDLLLLPVWMVWKERNNGVWSNKFLNVNQLLFQSFAYFQAFEVVQPRPCSAY